MNPRLLRPPGRVMVVEDEPRMRELLVRTITQWGFTVSSARSGEEAARLAAVDVPEILVLDLNLPGMDGLDLLRMLRAQSAEVQAIVLTGFASLESAKQAVHLDVVEFLSKPCHLGELEQALDRAMRRLMGSARPADVEATASTSPADDLTLEAVEREHILSVLEKHDGNRTAAATALGISRRTLYYKLEQYEQQGFMRS